MFFAGDPDKADGGVLTFGSNAGPVTQDTIASPNGLARHWFPFGGALSDLS